MVMCTRIYRQFEEAFEDLQDLEVSKPGSQSV